MKKMRKLLLTIISLVMVLVTFGGLTSSITAQEKEYTIGIDGTFAPFTYVDEAGEFKGIDIDIFKAIAEDQNINYTFQQMSFSGALQALEANQIDGMIAGMAITPEREEAFTFADSYYEGGNMFAVRADSEITNLEELEGKTVAAKTGTKGLQIAEDYQDEYGYDITIFEDSANMYEAVMVGHADATIEVTAVMAFAIATGQVDLKQIGDDVDPSQMGFAINDDANQPLVDRFNAGLANIRANGTYDAILEDYLGEEAIQTQTEDAASGDLLGTSMPALLDGLWTTIWISVVTILISTIIGGIAGLMKVSDNKLAKGIATAYVYLMRGIPVLVFVFFVYFGVAQWFGVNFSPETAGVAALAINTGEYIAEIIRGGIESIALGQSEAGRSLGLTKSQTMQKIVLPQAIKNMVPSFINQFIMTLKNTSILSVIGIIELTQSGKIIISRTYQSGNIWLIVGVMYLILITLLTILSNYVEKKYLK